MSNAKTIVAALICMVWALVLNAQQYEYDAFGYPVYDSVAVRAAANSQRNAAENHNWFSLAKKQDGWYVCNKYYADTLPLNDNFRKCWDRKTGKYVMSAEPQFGEDEYKLILDDITGPSNKTKNFDLCIYFGYLGWTEDVIHEFEGKEGLTDAQLESLSRAYSNEAFSRIGQWREIAKEKMFDMPETLNCMSAAQRDTFLFYESRAAEMYYRIWKQNPAFENFVGSAYTEYSNEIMSTYLALAYLRNMEDAAAVLKPDLFDPFSINMAKNYLNSCPPNAILFTQGDMDTYPLYYVQAQHHYRTDVLLVNLSLIGTARYINFVRAGVFDAKGYPMTLKPEEYAGTNLDILRIEEKQAEKLRKATRMDVKWQGSYLLKNDIAVLDMLAANKGKRPVCFAVSVAPEALLGLAPYATCRGMVYEIHPKVQDKLCSSIFNAKTDLSFNYNYFMQDMFYTNWAALPFIEENIQRMSVNCLAIFSRTAQDFIDNGDTAKAYRLLEKCLQQFPDEVIPYGVFVCNFPDLMAKCGHADRAKLVAEKLLLNSGKKFDEYIEKLREKPNNTDYERSIKESLYTMQEVMAFGKRYYANASWVEELEAGFDKKRRVYGEILSGE